jgi:hypothetical protein
MQSKKEARRFGAMVLALAALLVLVPGLHLGNQVQVAVQFGLLMAEFFFAGMAVRAKMRMSRHLGE